MHPNRPSDPSIPAVEAPSIDRPAGPLVATHSSTIGRANLDGTGVDQAFITGASDPCGVAVDAGHVYWANTGDYAAGGLAATIGRAGIDGSNPDQQFIADARRSWSCGIAVDAGHVYWGSGVYTVGRAALDGSTPAPGWLAIERSPCGIAVDGGHVYWASGILLGIGRAGLDGTGADPYFAWSANHAGLPYACGVAVVP
jgi:hypothetical protein